MAEERKARDFWDKIGAISIFLSSVVIAGAGLIVNGTYNERQSQRSVEAQEKQHQLAKVQALSTLMPHLSGNKESREAAMFAITVIGYPELAVRLSQLRNEDSKTSDAIMRSAPASISSASRQAAASSTSHTDGWLYLGDFDAATKNWNTRYLTFDRRLKPEELVGKTYGVRNETGAINVRAGMPTDSGEFPNVIKVVKPGAQLHVQEVKQWLTTGYTWAKVQIAG